MDSQVEKISNFLNHDRACLVMVILNDRERTENMVGELSNYIYDKMIQETRNYQWRVISDSHKGAIEIYLAIEVEVGANQFVQDVTGQVNAEGVIFFEEVVCFYDRTNNKIVKNNYLNAIPVDPAQGIEAGYVDAFLKQLNIRISTAKNELRSFLSEKEKKEFSLTWNEENMKNTVETMKRTNNYSQKKLIFSAMDEKSLVEKFKGESYDGLERI